MSVNYVDIGDLSQKSSVAGTEKLPVSDTEYITPSQINAAQTIDDTPSGSSTNPLQNEAICTNFISGQPMTATSTTSGKYFKTDGTEGSSSSISYRKFAVTAGETYAFTSIFSGNFTTGLLKAVIWLNSSNTVIGYEKWANTNSVTTYFYDYLCQAPTGATTLVLNYRNTYNRAGVLKHVSPPSPECFLKSNITISSSEPTSSQGEDGDIWIVI